MAKIKRKSILMHHVCEYCGKEFEGNAKAKYCSGSCRALACKARKDTTGTIRGIGQAEKEPKELIETRQNARNIFRREIVRHPEIMQQAENLNIPEQYVAPAQPISFGELALYAFVGWLFAPKKKRRR